MKKIKENKERNINIRIGKKFEEQALYICEDYRRKLGVEITITAFLRGRIESIIEREYSEIKREEDIRAKQEEIRAKYDAAYFSR